MNRKEIVDGIIEYLDEMKEDRIWEMASLDPKETGLKYAIWLDPQGQDRNVPHNIPRVKVELRDGKRVKLIPVILYDDGARLLKGQSIRYQSEVERWVDAHRDIITKHYNKEITDRQALILLGKD